MATSIAGKAFLITGGASGMGLATVRTLLQRGASLGICDLDEDKLSDLIKTTYPFHNGRILVQPVDVADRSAVKNFLKSTKRQFGRLDGIANVAGTGGRLIGTHSIWDIPTEEYDLVMNANTRGVFNTLAEGLVPGFMETPGSIVNVGSMYSIRGFKNAAPYCCSKHAMVGLTKTAAIEAGERGIRVNAVLPYVFLLLFIFLPNPLFA